ncbi:MAG: hypothetical protein P8M07_03665 [Flavobacteriales bacterium]|nr:hypothetical protein [Flavobacteriales bacterium]
MKYSLALPCLLLLGWVNFSCCRPEPPVLLNVQLSDCSGEPLAFTAIRWSSGGTFGVTGSLAEPVLQVTDAWGRVTRPAEVGQRLELVEADRFGLNAQDVLYPSGYNGAMVHVVFPRLWRVEIVAKPAGEERTLEFLGGLHTVAIDEPWAGGFEHWGCQPPLPPLIDGEPLEFEPFSADTVHLTI